MTILLALDIRGIILIIIKYSDNFNSRSIDRLISTTSSITRGAILISI